MGKIVRARGIQGEVAVAPLTDFLDRFDSLDSVLVEKGAITEMQVEGVRSHKRQILLKFAEINSRTEAEKMVGAHLMVTKEQLVKLPDDSFYQFEIVGMAVYTEEEKYLGDIMEIISMPAHDLWRVKGEKNFDLPATKHVIRMVDRNTRKITVRIPEGLLDL